MGKDYYAILGVPRDADDKAIKKAYRKLALKWHPDKNPDNQEVAQQRFQEVSEAFEVLSDPQKRAVFDNYGEEGLKGGMPEDGGAGMGGAGGMPGGMPAGVHRMHFHAGDPSRIFQDIFGTSDPFSAFEERGGGGGGGGGGGMPGMMGGMGGFGGFPFPGGMMHTATMNGGGRAAPAAGQQRRDTLKRAAPVEHDLRVSLEEIFTGATKRVRITKKVLDAPSGKTMEVADEKEIEIRPGWKDGTRVTYERAGDERPGTRPADIVFIIRIRPHDRFERDGDDLIHNITVPLDEAMSGVRRQVETLDGRTVNIVEPYVQPTTETVFRGRGLPNQKTGRKGDLRVRYSIRFPPLNDDQRNRITQILRET